MTAREPLPVLAACGLAFEAALAAGRGVVAVCGPGPWRLAERLDALLDGRRDTRSALRHAERLNESLLARAAVQTAAQLAAHAAGETEDRPACDGPAWAGILSFGCAGALDPGLAPGTCILATSVQTADGFLCADAAWLRGLARRLPQAVHGELAGIDAPLTSARDKAGLWRASGACAVDMESHAAARIARRHGLPFAACRVVLDPAWRSVPPSALAAMGGDGRTRPGPLLRALAAAPGELGPLCMLAWNALLARRALGQVRARLGERLAAP